MIRATLLVAALFATAFLCAGCGPNDIQLEPHGLEAAPVVPSPEGEPLTLYTDVRPGRWRVDVTKKWTESRAGGPERIGTARLALDLEILVANGETRSTVEVSVLDATGLAAQYVAGFDGLKVSLAHDADGRPNPATLVFEAEASPHARSFLRGLWLAGLAGATPWFPPGALRQGDAWPRSRLGEAAYLMNTTTTGDDLPRFSGGGRVLSIQEEDGEEVVSFSFDGLVEQDVRRGSEAAASGMHDLGTLVVRARDGLPLTWTLTQEYRLRHVKHGIRDTRDIRLEVEAKTTAALEPGTPSDPDDE